MSLSNAYPLSTSLLSLWDTAWDQAPAAAWGQAKAVCLACFKTFSPQSKVAPDIASPSL